MTLWSQDGRDLFKELMVKMKLRHLNIGKTITDVQSDEIIKRLLVQECKTLVRVYIVGAFNLA